ncbi:MAG: hypothetical protein JWN21_2400, partial [Sphingomonas bacterium]|nr:hypothetical protein [Sphingomonas bacterium]
MLYVPVMSFAVPAAMMIASGSIHAVVNAIVTYGLALWASALGPTAPLAALRETGMATALLISALLMGEAVTPRRAGAVAGI